MSPLFLNLWIDLNTWLFIHCFNDIKYCVVYHSPILRELQQLVCKMANVLESHGVKRGDRVAIYLPQSPTAVAAMMACARIGAIHSVVFAGFSAEALAGRIVDGERPFVNLTKRIITSILLNFQLFETRNVTHMLCLKPGHYCTILLFLHFFFNFCFLRYMTR